MTAILIMSALVCLAGEYFGVRGLVYVGKPVATLVVILLAARGAPAVSTRYRALITTGLICSLVGDVFLMLPGDQFVAGLASFLVAHLLYITAFAGSGGGVKDLPAAAALFLIASVILAILWPALGTLRIPVSVYVSVIATMAWQAVARWRQLATLDAKLAAVGALVFLVSDASLAWRKFRGDFSGSVLMVLGTYWLAQWCIAQSVTIRRQQ